MYSGDRFDEEPRSYGGSTSSNSFKAPHLDDIDEWDTGKRNVVEEAFSKAKEFVQRVVKPEDPQDFNE